MLKGSLRLLRLSSISLLLVGCSAQQLFAQNDLAKGDDTAKAGSETEKAAPEEQSSAPVFELNPDVSEALLPLFKSVAQAEVSRATVEMTVQSKLAERVLDSRLSTYQIASIAPDKFTIYLKESEQRTRIYNDGESMIVVLAPDAYLRLADRMPVQHAVTSLPVPIGPYPELVLALSMAGVDPAISFVGGMKSIEIVDRDPVGEAPAVHLQGIQSDDVRWDLWIATDDSPRPLQLTVDLTPMLRASDQVQVPKDYQYELRFEFLSWRIQGDVKPELFTYVPGDEAKEYRSFEDYYDSLAGVRSEHPLLGKEAPDLEGSLLDGSKLNAEQFRGKVVVLDFWATWCAPCVASLPVMKRVTDEFADKDVLFFALNTGEDADVVSEFLEEKELELDVILDPDGTIATAFAADAIPQTLVIGKDGTVEAVHIGFMGEEALEHRLRDELDVLSIGGKIASAATVDASSEGEQKAVVAGTPENQDANLNDAVADDGALGSPEQANKTESKENE